MRVISQYIAVFSSIINNLVSVAVFIFLIWSMYFTGDYQLGVLRGILAFVLILLFVGIASRIPFVGIFFAAYYIRVVVA